jgi:glycosyltransferase involved in cell wall biosynthesis
MTVRILHVLNTPRAEGTPNLVLDWLAAGTDHWQAVMVLHSQPAELTERLRSLADAYEEHDLFDLGKRKYPRIARAAFTAVRRHRPDVVVCWPTGFANWVCAGARAGGRPRLLVHAGNPAGRGRRVDWLARYVMWPLAALGAQVICCSDYVRESIAAVPGVSGRYLYTVYNCSRAVDVAQRAVAARAARTRGEGPIALMVATLERHKDHDTLLRAVPLVRERFPSFRVRLAGDGSLREQLQRHAHEAGLGEAVEFLGSRRDVPELLGASDLFVLATTPQEGLGSVLLEALAARLPVIASDVPACHETLAGGRWGRLVPPGDPDALAEAIGKVLASPPVDNQLQAGADYAAEFTPRRMIDAYLTIAGFEIATASNDVEPAVEAAPV